MVALVKLVGIVMVVFGVIYLVKPAAMKQVVEFWKKGKRISVGFALNILIGIIFFFAASRCAAPWFVVIVGLLSLAKGIIGFIRGRQKTIAWMDSFVKKPAKTLRAVAIICLALGVLLIWSA